jgi:hypothetical protein
MWDVILADVPAAVFALEPCAGLADEAIARGVAVIVPAAVAIAIAIAVVVSGWRREMIPGCAGFKPM